METLNEHLDFKSRCSLDCFLLIIYGVFQVLFFITKEQQIFFSVLLIQCERFSKLRQETLRAYLVTTLLVAWQHFDDGFVPFPSHRIQAFCRLNISHLKKKNRLLKSNATQRFTYFGFRYFGQLKVIKKLTKSIDMSLLS